MSFETVGTGNYIVKAGDCLSSIAEAHGHIWETLWEHPANAELRRVRGSPDVLMPGDRVTVPPLRPKSVACQTGRLHTFRRKGVPTRVQLQLMKGDQPRANIPYELCAGREVLQGHTDVDGWVEQWVKPGIQEATLFVEGEEYVLHLGHLPPVESNAGARARLANMGYLDETRASSTEEDFLTALESFQNDEGLPPTAMLDAATRERLAAVHGC
ncbi:LysM peptidoglycan-binding domain-containing protein [Pyxidicoccus fallax]|uniref:LysM peptidoglycan-binding domain-containing protein n=1 Tax=Pyxidicoccus fallax TaxID=394095 RepID=A0A848LZH4_9BACT|nr:LysM peptidoglycan-binding domain-containing protein [Pyxidicoccus fallax]NMO22544.1 LysM peptidoglycan-binding domain-containing protein [Pyxidicoccus fallax]NPC85891.1 LysM peptidoglycan-binding domain-containing protein [Pyxidicoccus fallax]